MKGQNFKDFLVILCILMVCFIVLVYVLQHGGGS